MANAATPASRTFFMRTSLEHAARMAARAGAINLQFGKASVCYQDVIRSLLTNVSDHSKQMRQPERNLRNVGDQGKENQNRAQPRQHRDRDFADAHFCDAA